MITVPLALLSSLSKSNVLPFEDVTIYRSDQERRHSFRKQVWPLGGYQRTISPI